MKKLLLILLIAIVATEIVKDVTLKFPPGRHVDEEETGSSQGSLTDYLDGLTGILKYVYELIKPYWDEIRKNIKEGFIKYAIGICKLIVYKDKECSELINNIAKYF